MATSGEKVRERLIRVGDETAALTFEALESAEDHGNLIVLD